MPRRFPALYDVADEKLPVVLKDNQNTPVPSVEKVLEPKDVMVSTEEVTYWFHCQLGKFLRDFCDYKGLYTVAHEKDDPAAYNNNIALAAKLVANAFGLARGSDVKAETPTQIGFEITIKGIGSSKIDKIPDESAIVSTSLFFDILGLRLPIAWDQAPNTTCGNLKELLQHGDNQRPVPWMHKVESDVVRAASARTVSGDVVTFRGENGKVYWAILVSYKLFINGDRRFYLLFIETIDRRFVGSPRSSLLLTALILASRWRFSYFERWSNTVDLVFGKNIPVEDFSDSCKQLLYNIDWIELEAAEFGTSNVNAMKNAFGPEVRARVERFFSDWEKAKKDLFTVLPGLDITITQTNRETIRNGVMGFLESTRLQNEEFLTLAIQAYADEVKEKG